MPSASCAGCFQSVRAGSILGVPPPRSGRSARLLGRSFFPGYVTTDEGWLDLAAVKDMAKMENVGWSMSEWLKSSLAVGAMRMALQNRRPAPGLICHSDRGIQYASGECRQLLDAWKAAASMSRKGDCLDSAPMESFFGSRKTELVCRTGFRSRREANAALSEYIAIF